MVIGSKRMDAVCATVTDGDEVGGVEVEMGVEMEGGVGGRACLLTNIQTTRERGNKGW